MSTIEWRIDGWLVGIGVPVSTWTQEKGKEAHIRRPTNHRKDAEMEFLTLLKLIGYLLAIASGAFLVSLILYPVTIIVHNVINRIQADKAQLERFKLETIILRNKARIERLLPDGHGFQGVLLDTESAEITDLDKNADKRQRLFAALGGVRLTRVQEILPEQQLDISNIQFPLIEDDHIIEL